MSDKKRAKFYHASSSMVPWCHGHDNDDDENGDEDHENAENCDGRVFAQQESFGEKESANKTFFLDPCNLLELF